MNVYDEVKWACPECGESNSVEILESFDDCHLCDNCGRQYEVEVEIDVKNIEVKKVDDYE